MADDEAEVALFGARGHLEAAFGCVGEAVDFGEGHFGWCLLGFVSGVGCDFSLIWLLRTILVCVVVLPQDERFRRSFAAMRGQ